MTGTLGLQKFKEVFPFWVEDIRLWKLNKDDTIQVELSGKRFFVFTYIDEHTWRIETVRMHKRDENKR